MDDVVLGKMATIGRCLARVQEEYGGDDRNLFENITRQGAILLNLQRACEAAIDLTMHVVAAKRLGIPRDAKRALTS